MKISQQTTDTKRMETLKKDVIWAVFGNAEPTKTLTPRQLEKLKNELKYHELTSTFESFQNCQSPRTKYTFNKEKYEHYLELIMADYTAA